MTASAVPFEHYILYQKNRYKCIKLRINKNISYSAALSTINQLAFPDCPCSDALVRFVIMELLDNSIRAQHRNGSNNDIIVEFRAENTRFRIFITDYGGGIQSPVSTNFGMGIPAARKVFPEFAICCHDGYGHFVPCGERIMAGTRIELGIEWNSEYAQQPSSAKPASLLELSLYP